MKKVTYLKQLFEAYNSGRISVESYEAGLMNIETFCEEEEEETEE